MVAPLNNPPPLCNSAQHTTCSVLLAVPEICLRACARACCVRACACVCGTPASLAVMTESMMVELPQLTRPPPSWSYCIPAMAQLPVTVVPISVIEHSSDCLFEQSRSGSFEQSGGGPIEQSLLSPPPEELALLYAITELIRVTVPPLLDSPPPLPRASHRQWAKLLVTLEFVSVRTPPTWLYSPPPSVARLRATVHWSRASSPSFRIPPPTSTSGPWRHAALDDEPRQCDDCALKHAHDARVAAREPHPATALHRRQADARRQLELGIQVVVAVLEAY